MISLIFLQLDAGRNPLHLRPELRGLLNEAKLGALHATCRALRKWCLAWYVSCFTNNVFLIR